MKCKKSLMGLAALLILVFHFYIPFTGTDFEKSLYKGAYLGVDIFFFVSAYSLSRRGIYSYFGFLKNRLLKIYVPFVLFSVVGFIYGKWEITRFLKVISGVEFFTKGGGAFLWFFIGIMIFYFLAPFMVKAKFKFGFPAMGVMLLLWLALVVLLEYVFKYRPLFILVNRLPIFVLGLYYDRIRDVMHTKAGVIISTLGLICGYAAVYKYASFQLLNKPVYNTYYIVALPFVFFLIVIWDYVSDRATIKNVPLNFLGGFTLELYALQMIFGYKIETSVLGKLTIFKPCAFWITAVILVVMAWLVNITYNAFTRKIFKR